MGARFALGTALIAGAWLALLGGLADPAWGQSPAAQCATTHWVGAWAADPSGTLGAGSTDQTLRIILTPHIGGSALRVHLSNRFGPKPVTFTRATIALRQAGATLVPGSSRPLTFAGQTSVSVPAGGEALSDPAPLTFGAFQDLAVSLYLADATGPATGHLVGRERSYATARSAGDHTVDEAPAAFVSNMTTVNYVDGVDALAASDVGAAVLFGDSITDGYESAGGSGENQAGIDASHRYPDYLARRLLAQPGGPRLSVVNAGISGNRLLADGQQGLGGLGGLNRLNTDVLGVAGVTDAVVVEGINDIALLASANQMETALTQAVNRLHAGGLNVLLGTISPAGTGLLNLGNLLPSIYIDSSSNAVRVAVNAWIRSGASGADGIVDFDAAVRSPTMANELNPSFDSGDHVHPSYAGYMQMAAAINLAALRGAPCAAAPPRLATRLRVRANARPTRHLRVSGSLLATGSAASCQGAAVSVRALHGGRTILLRRLALTRGCRFAATKPISAHGRIEVRISFAGSPTLLPSHARPVYVRAA